MAARKFPFDIKQEQTTIGSRQTPDPVQQYAHLKTGLSDSQDLESQPASLLTIPRELRDEIYSHLLKPNRRIPINLFPYDEATRAFLALSVTCTQTRAEVTDLFFKNNFMWTVSSGPHYSCEPHLRRLRQLDLILDTKVVRSEIMISSTPQQVSVIWDQQMWTMPITGGQVQMRPFPEGLSSGRAVDLYRRNVLLQRFHHCIKGGLGVNIDALGVLGEELRKRGWDCAFEQADR